MLLGAVLLLGALRLGAFADLTAVPYDVVLLGGCAFSVPTFEEVVAQRSGCRVAVREKFWSGIALGFGIVMVAVAIQRLLP